MNVMGDAKYFDSDSTRIAQLTRDKQSGNLQQYDNSVQTFGVLKQMSDHMRYYHSQSNTHREQLAAQVLGDSPP